MYKYDYSQLEYIKDDLYNKTFGILKVVGRSKEKINNKYIYKCQCECGNIAYVNRGNLKSGNSKSCGCISRNKTIQRNKSNRRKNNYTKCDNYMIGYTLNKNTEFYFDLEDFDKVKEWSWTEDDKGYIMSRNKQNKIFMHRLIMNVTDKETFIDHINYNTKDNRKENLRITTLQYNNIHKNMYNKNGNRIGVYDNRHNKWCCSIRVNGKGIHLGTYETYEMALRIRQLTEIMLYGEYACQDSIEHYVNNGEYANIPRISTENIKETIQNSCIDDGVFKYNVYKIRLF